jgi:hypothetical protein
MCRACEKKIGRQKKILKIKRALNKHIWGIKKKNGIINVSMEKLEIGIIVTFILNFFYKKNLG